jgi:NCS1 family nucleobase:cation symporter-1
MVLMRTPLGQRGSWLPTVLNAAQCVGWAIFELLIIATAVAALSDELLGFRAQWLWTVLFGGIALAMAVIGPIDFVRKFVRKFAVWFVLASLLYLTWWALEGAELGELWRRDGEGGSSVLEGVDLVVSITVSWIPLVADYTRFSRDRRSALGGVLVGYFLAGTWMFLLGAVLVLGRGLDDAASLPAAVAAAGLASALALLAVTVDETDEAFANTYSAAVSIQNVVARVSQRALVVAVAAVATAGALVIDLASYESFLLLLGSFFVPLFGVLLGDWLIRGARYTEAEIFDAPSVRPAQLGAWLVGFALYQWLHPLGPAWWTDLLARTSPPDLAIGSTIPSFAVSLGLAAAAGAAVRRWRPARSPA